MIKIGRNLVPLLLLALLAGPVMAGTSATYDLSEGTLNSGALSGGSASYSVLGAAYGATATQGYSSGFALYLGSPNWSYFSTLVATSEFPIVTQVTPAAGPAGTRISVIGSKFGMAKGASKLVFANTLTGTPYVAEIISWSDTVIEAIMPSLATAGTYDLKVVKNTILSGVTYDLDSNIVSQQISAAAVAGAATIYPNPFNAGKASVNIVLPSPPSSTSNIGFYIYNTAAQLVYKQVISSPNNSITWNGLDSAGALVGNGIFLVRIADEDSRTLLAKGKILVIKQ
jgi:hypothetical protein